MSDPFKSVKSFKYGQKTGHYYSLKALGEQLGKDLSRLPVSIRIVLESVLRNCDGKKVTEQHVKQLASWKPRASRTAEIPFVVARVVLQDFTGVPLLADLAAMRNVPRSRGDQPAHYHRFHRHSCLKWYLLRHRHPRFHWHPCLDKCPRLHGQGGLGQRCS